MAAQWYGRILEILHKFRPEAGDVERKSAPDQHRKTLLKHLQEDTNTAFFGKCFAKQEKSHANEQE